MLWVAQTWQWRLLLSGQRKKTKKNTCTRTPGRKRCRIFSKISFWSTSHVTVRSKYRIKGFPNLRGAQRSNSFSQFEENLSMSNFRSAVRYLRPCCPAQARLHTSRTIFSACPLFLLGLWGGVLGSCICVWILLLSVPYFRLFWLRFACGLPAMHDTDTRRVIPAAGWYSRHWYPSDTKQAQDRFHQYCFFFKILKILQCKM